MCKLLEEADKACQEMAEDTVEVWADGVLVQHRGQWTLFGRRSCCW